MDTPSYTSFMAVREAPTTGSSTFPTTGDMWGFHFRFEGPPPKFQSTRATEIASERPSIVTSGVPGAAASAVSPPSSIERARTSPVR